MAGILRWITAGGTTRWAALSVLVFLGYAVIGILRGPSPVAGDDLEYYLNLYAVGRHHTLAIDDRIIDDMLQHFPGATRAHLAAGLYPFRDGFYDTMHFWGISVLAAPFYPVCQLAGISWKHCFTLLNGVLFALAIFVAGRARGWAPVVLFPLAVLSSPLVPYLMKAHSEAFVVCLVTIGLYLLLEGRYLAAAAATCLLAQQVSAFSPLALLLLVAWAWRARRGGHRLAHHVAFFASLGCLALQPVYMLCRYHTPNIIIARGYVWPDMATPKRMSALFLDPDVGLLMNWPAAVALVAAAVAVPVLLRQRLRLSWSFWIAAALFFLSMPYIHAQQANFSTACLRYAFWYMLFLIVPAAEALHTALTGAGRTWARAVVLGLLAVGLAVTGYYNHWVRNVRLLTLARSPLAEWFYREFPDLYNPDEQIYLDIGMEDQVVNGRSVFVESKTVIPGYTDRGFWATSNAACNKLFILTAGLEQRQTGFLRPAGCKQPLEADALVARLRRAGRFPSSDGYVTVPPELLGELTPRLDPGQVVDFRTREAEKFLGAGWSVFEPWGRWSVGRKAELKFRSAAAGEGPRKLMLELVFFAEHVSAQRVRLLVNGIPIGAVERPHSMQPEQIEFLLPERASQDVHLMFEIERPVPVGWRKIYARPLGIALVKLWLAPVG